MAENQQNPNNPADNIETEEPVIEPQVENDAVTESEEETVPQDATDETVQEVPEEAPAEVTEPSEPVTRLMEEAVDAVTEETPFPTLDESTVQNEEPTSVEGPEDLVHTGGGYGFTGEIIGRVYSLQELDRLQEEEVDSTFNQFRTLIEQTLTDVTANEIVKGRVVSVGEKDVVIDIGFKSDGIVSKNEFDHELSPGDEVEVFLERIEDYQGQLVLSKSKADTVRRWQRIVDAYEQEQVLEGTIVRRIKGGMIVELFDQMEAFLPGSQIDVRPVRDFDAYLDKRMEFKIVKLNEANENIVVSHKALIEKELEAQRKKILSTMEPGQVLEGTVKNITDFGVFIDLGGVDGLLHITDLSWGRVSHPSELVSLDQKLNVAVLDYDKERQRISLGLKQLQSHPWENIGEKYHEEDVVEGKVVSITDYGAFVELEKGIEGLVHISEMSWTEHIRHPSQMVALGQLVNVKILNIDHEGKKISLGMKQLQPDPWQGIAERYPAGTVLRGKVRNITNFGVFVEIEPGIDGLVHISDLSWTKRIRHPSEIVKKGQELDVVILNVDEKERRISLGHKQVETNPWNQFAKLFAEGNDTEATITRIEEKGLVVDLPLDVEAFVPSAELKNGQHFQDSYRIGDRLDLRVIRFDANNKEIILSETAKYRAEERAKKEEEQRERRVERDRERKDIGQYAERATTGPTTFGELAGLAELKHQMEAAERSSRAEENQVVTTPAASSDLEGTPGVDNRGEAGKQPEESGASAESPTEPPAKRKQRSEDAGSVLPSEKSKAALKDTGETEKEGMAEAAEEVVEDKTPSRGSGAKPVSTMEIGESPEEIQSFTHPEGDEEAPVVTTDDVAKPEKEEEPSAEAEMGEASATVRAESKEDAEDVAGKTEE